MMTCNNSIGYARTWLESVVFWLSYIGACFDAFVRDCLELAKDVAGLWKLRRRISRFGRAFPKGDTKNGALSVLEGTKRTYSSSDIFESVAQDILILEKNLQSIVGQENTVLKSAADHIFGAGGKRIRPALVFLVSKATAMISGLKDITEGQRRLAEIVELIHTASLIHDDIIDESDMRRGKETVHQLYGAKMAVLAGDFMLAKSSVLLSKLQNFEIIHLISEVIGDLVSGEIKQVSDLFNCDIQVNDYLMKSHHKTASLIAACTKGAVMLSRAVTGDISDPMYQYGMNLGLSFQVVDDILDFTQSAQQLGKPSGSDLAKGILTAPVIFALQKDPKLRVIIESKFYETGYLEEAIGIVKSSGGIDRARELAREIADKAVKNLRCLPPSPFRVALERLVDYNLERIK